MARVPHEQRTCIARDRREFGDSVQCARSILNHGQRHEGRVIVDNFPECFGCHELFARLVIDVDEVKIEVVAQPFEDVSIGGEVRTIGDHFASTGSCANRRVAQLVEVHTRRVDGKHLSWSGAKRCATDQVTGRLRLIDPVVPSVNESVAPFGAEISVDGVDRCAGKPTEGVAIQITQRIIDDDELVSERGERVVAVELLGKESRRGSEFGHVRIVGLRRRAVSCLEGPGRIGRSVMNGDPD